ncbi:MAG: iron uptake transporter deferrochelatase/peroxidase subunit [Kineosporiaceae bacterium]
MRPRSFDVSRRGLFGSAVAAAALGGGAVAAFAGEAHAAAGGDATSAGPADTVYPFEGAHQQGIVTPSQAAAAYLALDVEAADRAELVAMFKALTTAARWLTAGGVAPDVGMTGTSLDNGVLGGPSVPADGLTITVSVGASLFDHRYGLAAKKPHRLVMMPAFADDLLDRSICDGDLLIQVCADHQDTVNRALRVLLRETRGSLAVRWRQDGFVSPSRPDGAPRNLLGFKDGTANSAVAGHEEELVWTHAGGSEPAWVEGGSYHVVRKIRMLVEFWDRVSVREQNTLIGRDKASGAPLTGTEESDAPDFNTEYKGEAIALGAHIRLAADSGRSATTGQRMLRRGYNYDAGMDVNGNLDMGLLFTTFNQDLERQFATVQRRLEGESLADYILPVGGGYFFALPGVRGSDDWLGRGMFA